MCFISLGFEGVPLLTGMVGLTAAFVSVFAGSFFFLGRGVEGIEKRPWMPVVLAKNFRTFRRGTFFCLERGDDDVVPIPLDARGAFLCCVAEIGADTAVVPVPGAVPVEL